MLKKGVNYNIDKNEILKDNKTKYRITFDADFAYDLIDDTAQKQLDDAVGNDDKSKFKKIFNEYAEKENLCYRIRKITSLRGPGGGWPDIEFETIKPMTFKYIINALSNEYFGSEEDAVFSIFGDDWECNVVEVVKE